MCACVVYCVWHVLVKQEEDKGQVGSEIRSTGSVWRFSRQMGKMKGHVERSKSIRKKCKGSKATNDTRLYPGFHTGYHTEYVRSARSIPFDRVRTICDLCRDYVYGWTKIDTGLKTT